MQKLAIFLRSRCSNTIRIDVEEKSGKHHVKSSGKSLVRLGGRTWIEEAKKEDKEGGMYLVITPEVQTSEDEIFQYQSGEKLYRSIAALCGSITGSRAEQKPGNAAVWDVFTSDASNHRLTAASLVWAELMGRKERTLYINLSECCGMERLLELEKDKDLGDLFLDLRKQKSIAPEHFLGRVEHLDYILPLANPTILHELNRDDLASLISLLEKDSTHQRIVMVMGTTCLGNEQVFARADHLYHITESGLGNAIAADLWINYVRQICGKSEVMIHRWKLDEIPVDCPGQHLLEDWCDGPVGRQILAQWNAQQELGQADKRNMEQEAGKAGNAGSLAGD